MRFWPILTRLLAALALIGLLAAPVSAPKAASPAQSGMSMDMPEDMPCCPTKQGPPCHTSCPDMALCFAKCAPAIPTVSAALALPVLAGLVRPGDEARWDTRAERPPPRPPRA